MIVATHLLQYVLFKAMPKSQCQQGLDTSLWEDKLWCPGEAFIKPEKKIVFDPPVFEQRYSSVYCVIQTLKENTKIVDLGCAELKLFHVLKRLKGVEKLIHVDIDGELLERRFLQVKPQVSDYLLTRSSPLNVQVFRGSAELYHPCLSDVHVVVAVELIEHLYADVLERVTENIFRRIRPPCVIITTPNSEFNVLFTDSSGPWFRHDDHKFEWTRLEFQQWAVKVLEVYGNYSVKLYGIGPGPAGTEHLGCCSQMAVFTMIDTEHYSSAPQSTNETDRSNYSLICEYDYPVSTDTRSVEQKVSDEVRFWLRTVQGANNYADLLPLSHFNQFLQHIAPHASQHHISCILKKAGWKIEESEGEYYINVTPSSSASSASSAEDTWWEESDVRDALSDPDCHSLAHIDCPEQEDWTSWDTSPVPVSAAAAAPHNLMANLQLDPEIPASSQ